MPKSALLFKWMPLRQMKETAYDIKTISIGTQHRYNSTL